MPPPVLEHVDQSIPDRARRRERAGMVSLGPHRPPPAQHTVHGLGDANGEALQAADETAVRVGFDDQVHVIGLDGEGEHPKATTRRAGQCAPHSREDIRRAQRRRQRCRPQRHVNRMTWIWPRAGAMRDPRASRDPLAAGTTAGAAVGADDEGELSWMVGQLDWADIIETRQVCQVGGSSDDHRLGGLAPSLARPTVSVDGVSRRLNPTSSRSGHATSSCTRSDECAGRLRLALARAGMMQTHSRQCDRNRHTDAWPRSGTTTVLHLVGPHDHPTRTPHHRPCDGWHQRGVLRYSPAPPLRRGSRIARRNPTPA